MKSSRSSFSVFAILCFGLAATAVAQSGDIFREHFRLGREALQEKDYAAYQANMREAIEALPAGDGNRPFVLYHLARAQNLNGHPDEAAASLARIFDEDIEGLMIDYWRHDPALKSLAENASFQKLLDRVAKMEVRIHPLAGSVYLIEGAGCNLAALIGPDGAALVDTGYGPASKAVERALRSVAEVPVRYLIDTHFHEDHVAGNAALGGQAVRISHRAARESMQKPWPFMEDVLVPPMDAAGLPNLTLDDQLSIFLGGEEIRLLALTGHTDGDLAVYFVQAGVLHMGDNYFPDADQVRFLYTGGDAVRFLSRVSLLLDWLKPEDWVISGHSPTVRGRQLIESIRATQKAVDWLTARIQSGSSLESIIQGGLPKEWTPWAGQRGSAWWAQYLARGIAP